MTMRVIVTPDTSAVSVSPNVTPVSVTTTQVVATGPRGFGVPAGGTAGQVLTKASDDDFDTLFQAPLDVAALAAEWNDADTVYKGISLDVTDTASDDQSLLFDLKIGDVSQFSVKKKWAEVVMGLGSVSAFRVNSVVNGIAVGKAGFIGFGQDNVVNLASGGSRLDARFYRDGADMLAQRRGTNPQQLNVYNSFTDASNYERGFLKWNSNVLEIGVEAAGTGTQRELKVKFQSPSGSAISPNLSWDLSGFFSPAAGMLGVGIANAERFRWNVNGAQTRFKLDFGPTMGSPDAGLVRDSVGVLKVTDGSTGFGDLLAGEVSLTPTWDSADVETAFLLDVTNTASASGSLLMDLKTDGTSIFSIKENGRTDIKTLNVAGGVYGGDGNWWSVNNLNLSSNTKLSFGLADLQIWRDAADTLAQRRGTNPQTQRWYGSYTDASNNEGFEVVTQAGDTLLRSFANGTGINRNISLQTQGSIKKTSGGYAYAIEAGSIIRYQRDLDLVWSSSTNAHTGITSDTGLSRAAAGVVKVTDGSTGTGELIFIVPTTDPGITGALWNDGGTLSISA